jgi:LysR family nitrogen assimilation transcriptional regulator
MQVRGARDELTETRDAMVGHVILGLPPSIARLLAVPLVKSFRNSFPGGTLGAVEAMSAPIVEWLVEGRVDIGLESDAATLRRNSTTARTGTVPDLL